MQRGIALQTIAIIRALLCTVDLTSRPRLSLPPPLVCPRKTQCLDTKSSLLRATWLPAEDSCPAEIVRTPAGLPDSR